MNSLYDLTTKMRLLDEKLNNDSTEVSTAEYIDTISILTDQLLKKTDNVVEYSQSQTDMLDIIDIRIKALQDLKRAAKSKQERFLDYVGSCMQTLGVNQIQGNIHKIIIPKGMERVEVNEDELPEGWFKKEVTYTPMKAEIKKVLKDGGEVKGARLVRGKSKPRFK